MRLIAIKLFYKILTLHCFDFMRLPVICNKIILQLLTLHFFNYMNLNQICTLKYPKTDV